MCFSFWRNVFSWSHTFANTNHDLWSGSPAKTTFSFWFSPHVYQRLTPKKFASWYFCYHKSVGQEFFVESRAANYHKYRKFPTRNPGRDRVIPPHSFRTFLSFRSSPPPFRHILPRDKFLLPPPSLCQLLLPFPVQQKNLVPIRVQSKRVLI